jgi:ubiquinone/menaquinone biosynthesis C-methylase UbiE
MTMDTSSAQPTLDTDALERAVKSMYQRVAETPDGDFHFETGRHVAESLGYDPSVIDEVPAEAMDSFAGVGCHFRIADIGEGESVIDLGSGSGTDCFYAARLVGRSGRVCGLDMTRAQLDKAERLRDAAGDLDHVEFHEGYIENAPFDDESFDCVISNGVINLVADKEAVFAEAYRLLRPGGRLALSDIVTAQRLPDSVTCDETLWAACIGGAMHRADYQEAITAAGFTIQTVQPNNYEFKTGQARNAADKFEVSSISLFATKND